MRNIEDIISNGERIAKHLSKAIRDHDEHFDECEDWDCPTCEKKDYLYSELESWAGQNDALLVRMARFALDKGYTE